MSDVSLIISYHNTKVTTDSYCVQATVETTSVPTTIQDCLVIKRGSDVTKEQLVRIATFDEVYTSPLPVLPTTVDVFSSLSFGAIPVSTSIVVHSPDWWMQYFGSSPLLHLTTIDSNGTLSVPLPAFGNNLTFEIDGVTYTDGLANRTFADSETYYRTNLHCSEWDSYDVAKSVYTVLLSGAQPLVDSYNDDQFSIQTQKVYT